jgi:hypothetical protein
VEIGVAIMDRADGQRLKSIDFGRDPVYDRCFMRGSHYPSSPKVVIGADFIWTESSVATRFSSECSHAVFLQLRA